MANEAFHHFYLWVTDDEIDELQKHTPDEASYEAIRLVVEQALIRAFDSGHDNGYLVGKEDGREMR